MADLVDEVLHSGDKVIITSKSKPPYEATYHGRVNYRPGGLYGPLEKHPRIVFVDVNGILRKVDISRVEKARPTHREDGSRIIPGFCRHGYKTYECKVNKDCR